MLPETTLIYCPVCQSLETERWSEARDYEYFSTPGTYQYYLCRDCDTIYIHPVPLNQLNEIYPSNYYSFVSLKNNWVTRIKETLDKKHFKKILGGIRGDKLTVLDVGGGTGWLLDQLKKTDDRIIFTQVVDIDERAGQAAMSNGHAYAQMTVEQFETGRKFHLILLLNLVEHVEDPLAVLKKCSSLLAPNGIILVKTPNIVSWDARLFRKSYWGGLHCPRHWIIFSENSFRMITNQTGLVIKNLEYTQGAPFWAFSIITWLYRKKIVKISSKRPVIFHWLFAPLSALFAAFDFLRSPFAKTSQMFITLGKKEGDSII